MEQTCASCGKNYQMDKPENDDGCCSYECWEKINCQIPEVVADEFTFIES